MCIDFESLKANSKIYLYPSNKKFHPEMLASIETLVKEFIENWSTTHAIEVAHKISYQRFIIIGIQEGTSPSVAQLDELVSFIFKLQMEFDIELLDKLNVCFKQGQYTQYKDVKEFKKLIKSKSVTPKTIVFNNLINTKEELDHDWELPAADTWYSRMF